MKAKLWLSRIAVLAFMGVGAPLWASSSYYPLRLDDAKAVYLTRGEGGLHGDGAGDDTAAIQQAIDKVQETTGQGIVFIPEGRYRLSKTVFVWPGIRLIGYGTNRPVFVLGKNTPGYQDGIGYMVMFTGNRPPRMESFRAGRAECRRRSPALCPRIRGSPMPTRGRSIPQSATLISRFRMVIRLQSESGLHFAQHCYLAHMDFHIGSGLSALTT